MKLRFNLSPNQQKEVSTMTGIISGTGTAKANANKVKK